ncbi:hypothetical protein PGTUg99_035309 [Puccinia graminis f. sp. tritici]|uniref:Uncharacterized protein n=1 Tax=Puccinia graminis f. sp. tritici TaxID=56615 RepID=A0A5B0NNJ3_PUCGR|nr:hypothetical protein PGTUg99_035309 [Puccinia graminis f. sp. tritici]
MLSNRSCRRSRKPLVVFQAAIELSPRGDGAGETRDHLRRDPPIFLWGAFPAVEGCYYASDAQLESSIVMTSGARWVVGYYVIECNPFISTSEISQAEPHRYYQPTTTHLNKQCKHILEKPVQLAFKGYSSVTFHQRGGNRINNLRNL